ncbi:MAG: ankyrin repeat domain-containing protein [Fibromonadales bacterium]|nr:ankyrin repeat domain-containing protein [Fibromonadales bacterium]
MLNKIIIVGSCVTALMACGGETKLDPTSPESIRRHYSKLDPPVQMSEDQFVSYVKNNLATINKDTANMSMFLVCSRDYLNKPNSKGNTALSVAVNKKNPVVVKYLLEHGADIGLKSAQLGLSPLEDAATREDSTENGIFNMLVNAQRLKDPELHNIGAALHMAARYGAVNNVKLLVENGVNPNNKSLEGLTPLHEAAKEGKKSVVEYLLSKKVEINPVDKDGYTPVDWACAMGEGSTFPEVGKILKKAGARHTDAWRRAF